MKHAILTVDLLFGDSGKGRIVDALAEKYNSTLIVRFNGGAQASHNVVRNGHHHAFSQFGSASLQPNIHTLLSKFMLVDPLNMEAEAAILSSKTWDSFEHTLNKVFIDSRAKVVTPYHKAVNRIREIILGNKKNGSCGMGIGDCVADSLARPDWVLYAGDFKNLTKPELLDKLEQIRLYSWYKVGELIKFTNQSKIVQSILKDGDLYSELSLLNNPDLSSTILNRYLNWSPSINIVNAADIKALFGKHETVIFEAAQGVLLHENVLPPNNTWSDTSFNNAMEILRELHFTGKVDKVGICRSYATRHGKGPFVTEILPTDSDYTYFQAYEKHNTSNRWQDFWRVGHLDLVALQFANKIVGGIDHLAVTFCDHLNNKSDVQFCQTYRDKRNNYPWHLDSCCLPPDTMANKMTHSYPVLTSIGSKHIPELITENLVTKLFIETFGPDAKDTVFNYSL